MYYIPSNFHFHCSNIIEGSERDEITSIPNSVGKDKKKSPVTMIAYNILATNRTVALEFLINIKQPDYNIFIFRIKQ